MQASPSCSGCAAREAARDGAQQLVGDLERVIVRQETARAVLQATVDRLTAERDAKIEALEKDNTRLFSKLALSRLQCFMNEENVPQLRRIVTRLLKSRAKARAERDATERHYVAAVHGRAQFREALRAERAAHAQTAAIARTLQGELGEARAEIEQAREILEALENETLVEAARYLAHEFETTNATYHSIHTWYWKGAVPALKQIANRDDAEMANARTLHYDMRGWARAALAENPPAQGNTHEATT